MLQSIPTHAVEALDEHRREMLAFTEPGPVDGTVHEHYGASQFIFPDLLTDPWFDVLHHSFEIQDVGERLTWAREKFIERENAGLPTGAYGVADSIEQVIERWPFLVQDEHRYLISYMTVRHEDEPDRGGWRWHKWGPYIGTQDPQYEYLADESGIEQVICFHIYQYKDQGR